MLTGIIVVGIILIVLFVFIEDAELPTVYSFGEGAPHVVIVADTHGNEPAPGHALYALVKHMKATGYEPGHRLTIVPYVNISAVRAGVRSLWWQPDVNRSWNDTPTAINLYLMPLIESADIVLDMHEAWGTSSCTGGASLGQTIYTNTPAIDDMGAYIADFINTSMDPPECYRWTQRYKMKHIKGTLDEWCSKRDIPYMLIEMTGQNDVITMDTRLKESLIIVKSFLDYIYSHLNLLFH